MWDCTAYELLDFGRGRKLERWAGVVVDRPSPAAEAAAPARPELWAAADARYQRASGDRGTWHAASRVPAAWRLMHAGMTLELKLTTFGHVGVFPEQAENWQWIAQQVRSAGCPLKVLNLFAYTGASTLAAAAAGAEVVHVDAARVSVAWARRNAAQSGLEERPIRWIVEDARKFVQRELKRGSRYDGVILDPPSYGHGPRGQAWKLQQDLAALLAACGELLHDGGSFVLLSCHAPGLGPAELCQMLSDAGHVPRGAIDARELSLQTRDGRQLPSGVAARWSKS
jgi:23S rRNA (cytosine1962-C5)-methyltransferase